MEVQKHVALWTSGMLIIMSDVIALEAFPDNGVVWVLRAGHTFPTWFHNVTQVTSYYGKQRNTQ